MDLSGIELSLYQYGAYSTISLFSLVRHNNSYTVTLENQNKICIYYIEQFTYLYFDYDDKQILTIF